MHGRTFDVRRVWKFAGRHRVLPIDPAWLGGADYVIVEHLPDGAMLLRPARGVRDDGEAVRLEVELNCAAVSRDGG